MEDSRCIGTSLQASASAVARRGRREIRRFPRLKRPLFRPSVTATFRKDLSRSRNRPLSSAETSASTPRNRLVGRNFILFLHVCSGIRQVVTLSVCYGLLFQVIGRDTSCTLKIRGIACFLPPLFPGSTSLRVQAPESCGCCTTEANQPIQFCITLNLSSSVCQFLNIHREHKHIMRRSLQNGRNP